MKGQGIRGSLGRIRSSWTSSRRERIKVASMDRGYRLRRRLSIFIVLLVAAGVVFTAAAATSQTASNAALLPKGDFVLGVPAAAPTSAAAYDAYNQSTNGVIAPEAAVGGRSATTNQSTQQTQPTQPQPPDWDRMIIRTATLQMRVKDVQASLDQVRSLAGAHGGYVSQSDSHQEGDYTVSSLTIQVPAREFDSVISSIHKITGKTISENVSSSDVTDEYTDLQSQLRNLQATESRMLALMQKATTIEDTLSLDRELRQIQGQIEQIQGRINFLGKRSEMSSITVSLYPDALPEEPVPATTTGWNPGEIAARAWNASLELLAGVGTFLITVAVFMWWAVPLLLLAAWLAVRPRRPITSTPAAPTGEASQA
jgi:hypothetical protein